MADNLKISVTADVSGFEKGMADAGDSLDDANRKVERTKSKWAGIGDALRSISPTFGKISDEWRKASEDIDKRMGKNTLGAKAMKGAVIASLVAIGLQAVKVATQFADETARMFDPQAYSRAQGRLDRSIRRLKTSIGALTSGLVNGFKKALAWILDGLNSVIERINAVVSWMVGFLSTIFAPVISAVSKVTGSTADAAENMEEVVEATSAGLANFDKLSTLNFNNMGDAEQAEELKEATEKYKQAGAAFAEDLQEALGELTRWLEDIRNMDLSDIWELFQDAGEQAWDNIRSWGEGTWNEIRIWGEGVWNDLLEYISGIWDDVKAYAHTTWDNFKTEFIVKIGEWTDGIRQAFGNIWAKVKSDFLGIIEEMVNNAISKINRIPFVNIDKVDLNKDGATTSSSDSGSVAKTAGSSIGNAISQAGKVIADTFNKSYVGQGINKIRDFLGFASGGVVEPNDPFLAWVGDNRTEREVISPVSTMKAAFKEAMAEMGASSVGGASTASGGGRVSNDITLTIDGKRLVRMTFDDIIAEARRRGMKVIG